MEPYYIYIMSNRAKTVYIGVTNNIYNVILEHKGYYSQRVSSGRKPEFTKLVYYEEKATYRSAVHRSNQIEGWARNRKVSLIEAVNPEWLDVSSLWMGDEIEHML